MASFIDQIVARRQAYASSFPARFYQPAHPPTRPLTMPDGQSVSGLIRRSAADSIIVADDVIGSPRCLLLLYCLHHRAPLPPPQQCQGEAAVRRDWAALREDKSPASTFTASVASSMDPIIPSLPPVRTFYAEPSVGYNCCASHYWNPSQQPASSCKNSDQINGRFTCTGTKRTIEDTNHSDECGKPQRKCGT